MIPESELRVCDPQFRSSHWQGAAVLSQRIALKLCLALSLALVLVGCTTLPREREIAAPPPAAQTSAQTPNATIVAIAAPSPPAPTPPNLLDFLGINQIGKGAFRLVGGLVRRVQSRLGTYFPGLEPKPPLLSITDPANVSETSPPAVSAAAKVKAEEDAAPQKIKGLKYLATIGCGGCYPDVEQALLAALDDCTEAVRYEAVKALRGPRERACVYCRSGQCCSPAVQKKLRSIAYDLNEAQCHVEPSDRVRRLARLAIQACGAPAPDALEDLPSEGPREAVASYSGQTPSRVMNAVGTGSQPYGPSSPGTFDVQPASFTSPASTPSTAPAAGAPPRPMPVDADNAAATATPHAVANQLEQLPGLATVPAGSVADWPLRDRPNLFSWERITVNPNEFDSLDEARAVLQYVVRRVHGNPVETPQELYANQVTIQKISNRRVSEALCEDEKNLLQTLAVGQVSPVFSNAHGWHLIRVLGRGVAP